MFCDRYEIRIKYSKTFDIGFTMFPFNFETKKKPQANALTITRIFTRCMISEPTNVSVITLPNST